MQAQTAQTQAEITPDKALNLLKEGNQRFLDTQQASRDLLQQVSDTASGQYPFATVLSCIDSRVSSELIFDQGIGDIFSIRIAGNFVNEDILGSMEFACKLAGTKVLVVLGHTACGAVKGACDHARLGNLTSLIKKIEGIKTAHHLEMLKDMKEIRTIVTDEQFKKMQKMMPSKAGMKKPAKHMMKK